MGRGVFKRVIQGQGPAEGAAKKEAAPETQGSPAARPEVYGDVAVCRLLRIHRKVLADARTKKTHGVDWDCVGLHAGMTLAWIHAEALRRGIVPDFVNNPLVPIDEGDGVASCRLLATWPNRTRVTVEVVATGEPKVATVRDADEMHLNEIFDCRVHGEELIWEAGLNEARY